MLLLMGARFTRPTSWETSQCVRPANPATCWPMVDEAAAAKRLCTIGEIATMISKKEGKMVYEVL